MNALNDLAFDGPEGSRIITELRSENLITLSLVAEEKGRFLGHILFSRLPVTIDGLGRKRPQGAGLGSRRGSALSGEHRERSDS